MNLYQPSLTQYSQLAHAFSTLNQSIQQQPLVTIPSQPVPRHSTAYINALNQSQLAQNKNLAAYDFVSGPTKRVRHTQQDYTESPLKVEEVANNARGFVARNNQGLARDIRIVPTARQCNDEGRRREIVNIPLNVAQRRNEQSADYSDELTIPALKGLGLVQQRAENVVKQQILQQLQRQQQEFESFMKHQIAQQMEHQKLELDQLMYRMQEARRQEIASQEAAMFGGMGNLQFNHMQSQRQLNSQKLIGLGESNFSSKVMKMEKSPDDLCAVEAPELKVDDDYQYIKLEDYNEKSSEDSGNGFQAKKKIMTQKPAEKAKKTAYGAMKEAKKRKNQNYTSDYFGLMGKNLLGKCKEEPRRRNRWQKKDGAPEVEEEKPVQVMETEVQNPVVEVPQEVVKVKQPKPVEIPQHLQDDSLIDYKGMLALSITNDPALTGLDSMKFAVIRKEVKTTDADGNEGVINDTRVGNRFQANIPELKEKGAKEGKGRRRCPEVMWKPGTLSENDFKRYFEDLCKILKCDEINEERALKLLKRKNFKKEKVKVNITKNEKFYSSFLVVNNMTNKDNTTGEESFPQ